MIAGRAGKCWTFLGLILLVSGIPFAMGVILRAGVVLWIATEPREVVHAVAGGAAGLGVAYSWLALDTPAAAGITAAAGVPLVLGAVGFRQG